MSEGANTSLARTLKRTLWAAILIAYGAIPASGLSQALYKWVDKGGQTHYGDKPPKDSDGPVTRIEIDVPPDKVSAPPDPAPAAPAPKAAKPLDEPNDLLTRRRALRARLGGNLERARATLESAKQALAEGASLEDDERQTTQRRTDQNGPRNAGGPPVAGGMHGMSTAQSNCMPVPGKDPRLVRMCPSVVPNEKYFDRVQQLEDAVRRAEEELDVAQAAYRRGVD